jgi:hypothetical protein
MRHLGRDGKTVGAGHRAESIVDQLQKYAFYAGAFTR